MDGWIGGWVGQVDVWVIENRCMDRWINGQRADS